MPHRRVGEPLTSELFLQQFIDLGRIGLAFAGLHHLPDQCVKGLVFAGTEFLDGLGVSGKHLINDLFNFARV